MTQHSPGRPPRSRARRFVRWLGDVIGNAGVLVGASRSVSHTREAGGTDQYLGTAMSIEEARRRTRDGQPDVPKLD